MAPAIPDQSHVSALGGCWRVIANAHAVARFPLIAEFAETAETRRRIGFAPLSPPRRRPPCPPVRPEWRDHLVGASPTRAMVGWPGSWQAARMGNRPGRSPATKAASGGGANRRAVTCVKPEQASKGKSWTPTRPENGEGSTVWGSSRQMHPVRSIGVSGHSTPRQGIA